MQLPPISVDNASLSMEPVNGAVDDVTKDSRGCWLRVALYTLSVALSRNDDDEEGVILGNL